MNLHVEHDKDFPWTEHWCADKVLWAANLDCRSWCSACRPLFEGEGREATGGGKARVYAGGGHTGKVRTPKAGLSKGEKKKIGRHGKGVHGFKSKARHKRR